MPLTRAFRFLAVLSACAAAACAQTSTSARALLLDGQVVGRSIVAVGERGTVVRSDDSGRTWYRQTTPVHATLTSLTFAGPLVGWAAGHDGVILHTTDGGVTWTHQYSAERRDTAFLDIASLADQRLLAVGGYGTFYESADGGRSWTTRAVLDEDLHLNRVSLGSAATTFIAGERGTLLRIDAKGTVSRLNAPYQGSYYGILPLSALRLMAYGLRGHVFVSADLGETWAERRTGVTGIISTAVRLKSGTIVLAGAARQFVVSHDDGETFQSWTTPLTTPVAELIEAPDGSLIALGEAGATRLEAPAPRKAAGTSAALRAPQRQARRAALLSATSR